MTTTTTSRITRNMNTTNFEEEHKNHEKEDNKENGCPFCVNDDNDNDNDEELQDDVEIQLKTIGIQMEFEAPKPPKRFTKSRAKYKGKKLSEVLCENLQQILLQPTTSLEVRVREVVKQLLPNNNNYLKKDLRPSKKGVSKLSALVRHYIINNQPIPILIATAACKLPVEEDLGLDLAEVLFIDMLKDLNARVQVWYERGLDIRIRMEDSTTMILYDTLPELTQRIRNYVNGFEHVVSSMGASGFIRVSTESDLMPLWDYIQVVETATPIFKRYFHYGNERSKAGLNEPSEKEITELKKLQDMGWGAGVSDKARAYWIDWYGKQVKDTPEREILQGVSSYFSTILARKQLKGYGNDKSWERGHIDLALGVPNEYDRDSTRLFYRSAHRDNCPSSIPFWKLVGARVNKVNMALPADSDLLLHGRYVSPTFNHQTVNLPSVVLKD